VAHPREHSSYGYSPLPLYQQRLAIHRGAGDDSPARGLGVSPISPPTYGGLIGGSDIVSPFQGGQQGVGISLIKIQKHLTATTGRCLRSSKTSD
jgi:hypothetical protein